MGVKAIQIGINRLIYLKLGRVSMKVIERAYLLTKERVFTKQIDLRLNYQEVEAVCGMEIGMIDLSLYLRERVRLKTMKRNHTKCRTFSIDTIKRWLNNSI